MNAGDPPPDEKEPPPRISAHPSGPPLRASYPSRPPRDPLRIVFRAGFVGLWVAIQAALVLTADRRVDGLFGFRALTEASSFKAALFREVIGQDGKRTRIHVEDGVWTANDSGGLRRRFAWSDRVRRHELVILDREAPADVSAAATVARLQAALDDLATHTPDDADTRRFLLEVTIRQNGGEPYVAHLASADRGGGI